MVAVCVSPADLRPEVDDLSGAVSVDDRRADLAPAEAAAVEYGLRVADAWDGWVLVVAAARPGADPVLQELVALGAEVVRVDAGEGLEPGDRPAGPAELAGDPWQVAARLAAVIRAGGEPALVLCGDRSARTGVGAVPAFLAHELDLDQALGLVSIRIEGGRRLMVERRLDGGWRERLVVSGPAVLSVEGAGVRLRRAGLAAALGAGRPMVVRSTVARAGIPATGPDVRLHAGNPRPFRPRTHPVPPPPGDAHERVVALTGALSSREPARVVGPLSAQEAADELLAYLERFGYGPAPGPA
jgi:electron transfer flavoprotein beta subunit